jgi:hypothetical protein
MKDFLLDSLRGIMIETLLLGFFFQYLSNKHFKRLERMILVLQTRTEKILKGENNDSRS